MKECQASLYIDDGTECQPCIPESHIIIIDDYCIKCNRYFWSMV